MIKKPYIIAMLLLIGVSAYFVISPKKETKPVVPVNLTSTSDFKQVVKPSTAVNPPHGQPGHRCDIAEGTPAAATGNPVSSQPSFKPVLPVVNPPVQTQAPKSASTNITPSSVPKLNPPHGQPGHRCDVKTGDPLSPSGSSVTPQISVSKQSTPVISPASTSAKLNPAHGQPGHRCDIQVGSPLPAS